MDKIKVNLSYSTYNLLIDDMETFKFIKNNQEVNKNLFINQLIKNLYIDEKEKKENVFSLLNETFKKNKIVDNNDKLKSIIYEDVNKRTNLIQEKNVIPFSFRPNKNNIEIFDYIETNLIVNDTLSNYIRKLLNSYFSFTQAEREIILFKEEFVKINNAIKANKVVKLTINGFSFNFKPVKVLTNKEDTFVYVLGFNTRDNSCRTIHLYNFKNMIFTLHSFTLTDEEIKIIKDKESNPEIAYIFDENIINAKVFLTAEGKKRYAKIWFNRPRYYNIDKDGYYYFYGSLVQLLHYFTRLGKDAIVIQPDNLKEAIKKYYSDAFEAYNKK